VHPATLNQIAKPEYHAPEPLIFHGTFPAESIAGEPVGFTKSVRRIFTPCELAVGDQRWVIKRRKMTRF